MKAVVYYPDGTNVVYQIGTNGVVEMYTKGEGYGLYVNYDSPDKNIKVFGFPMIISNA